ncbi:DNA mismatch repair protein [Adhaeribacter aerolatus]|uniref:DNA mismatch repair protein n=1 Tax=Adhaeribacter aerolatus TaxID=670289 RepID=A0A512ARR2_9BACT|nr:DNA mismatch repair protein MutS [Adhaeribacter aerolatus]GEO02389.1 DNA mismatch repair protein [Adhaeribacter aerolatus]
MVDSPDVVFLNRRQAFAQQEECFKRQANAMGWLRLAIFTAGAVSCGYLFYHNQNSLGFVLLLVAYVVFLIAFKKHTRLQYHQKHNGFLKRINEAETERLNGKLSQFEGGSQFKDSKHPYTSDLDIFGVHSVYQLVNRAVTGIGKVKVANWLSAAAPVPEILERQAAVAELAADIDWRQHLQAKALHYKHQVEEPFAFFDWLKAPDFYRNKSWLKAATFILPVLTVASITLFFSGFSGYPAVIFMLAQYLLCYKYASARDDYYEQSSGMYDVLRSYRDLLEHLENRPSEAKKLNNLKQNLVVEGQPASTQIHRLAVIVEYLSARMNVYISFVLNAVLMWDFFWMYRLESWKKQVAPDLEHILDVIAETEALASLAAFCYAYPQYTWPAIGQTPFETDAGELGHPLIFTDTRITNNFKMAGAGHTCIITGSNMSGKSTFLRTLGVNLVLALAGSVVCARRFRLYPVQVFTAMRTEDNLAESTSSFYAELKRLRQLLDLTTDSTPVFYLLDEILKGTNSRDRHEGAKALIRQMHTRNAAGLVSTHDLELGAMQQEHPDYITNYSFNSTIEEDKILFDYKLQPGLCHSFNASKLMQLMGIAIDK